MSSELTAATPQGMMADTRPAVTVLAGFSPQATLAVAQTLLVTDPSLLLVRHDLADVRDGAVQRVVRTATEIVEDVTVRLGPGHATCTLHEVVLPALVKLSREHPGRDLLLVLPESLEPESLAAACRHCLVDASPVAAALRFDSYVTVVDARRAMRDLCSSDDLCHRGMHVHEHDYRAVAEVLVNQIEYADTVVLWSDPELDGYEVTRLATLLQRLAPWASHHVAGTTRRIDCTELAARLRRTGRHDPAVPGMLGRALEGFSVGVHEPAPDCGVVSVLFEARRPFHPQRLHDALLDLSGEALRSRGQTWVASQPDAAISWESAGGGVSLGSLGYWLAALPAERWSEATAYRRAAADLGWHPYYGDRRTALAFIGVGLDAAAVTDRLHACLISDDEAAQGFDTWAAWPDPFAGCFPVAE
ncbi:MAG: CobW family GTP-binding protein [Micromonosporaceae bacterium]